MSVCNGKAFKLNLIKIRPFFQILFEICIYRHEHRLVAHIRACLSLFFLYKTWTKQIIVDFHLYLFEQYIINQTDGRRYGSSFYYIRKAMKVKWSASCIGMRNSTAVRLTEGRVARVCALWQMRRIFCTWAVDTYRIQLPSNST